MYKDFSFGKMMKFFLISLVALIISKFLIRAIFSIGRDEMLSKYKKEKSLSLKTDSEVYELLSNTTDSINVKCPYVIDSLTTLLNTTPFQGRTFQYNYQLNIDTSNYDMTIFKNNMRKLILEKFINTSDSREFKEMKVTIVYSYTNSKNENLFNITFSPDKYE